MNILVVKVYIWGILIIKISRANQSHTLQPKINKFIQLLL
jgi:hypothetical protein